jgi:hypothetical protein
MARIVCIFSPEYVKVHNVYMALNSSIYIDAVLNKLYILYKLHPSTLY